MTPGGPGGPTTLSSLAHGGHVQIAAPRSRLGLIVGASAIVVGGAIGSALALRVEPSPARVSAAAAPDSPLPSAPSGTAPGAPAVAAPASAPTQAAAASTASAAPSAGAHPQVAPLIDPQAALVAQIQDTLRHFVAWSHAHPGARCPDAAALGAAVDPWGQPLRIVCSDQPADQIAGVLSYGPDGEPGTRDDVVSWTLGAEVTDIARGPRWSASRGIATDAGARHPGGPRIAPPGHAPSTSGASPHATPRARTGAGSNDTDGDGIPNRR